MAVGNPSIKVLRPMHIYTLAIVNATVRFSEVPRSSSVALLSSPQVLKLRVGHLYHGHAGYVATLWCSSGQTMEAEIVTAFAGFATGALPNLKFQCKLAPGCLRPPIVIHIVPYHGLSSVSTSAAQELRRHCLTHKQ